MIDNVLKPAMALRSVSAAVADAAYKGYTSTT